MRTALLLLALTATAHAQWDLQTSNTTASLRGIHALGNGIAWASGSEGTVLHTTDNGTHWQRCTTPPHADKLDFRGIQAFDAETAIVMSSGKGDLSRLYKTADACATWKLVFTNPDNDGFFDALSFSGTRHEDIIHPDNPLLRTRLDHPDVERHVIGGCGYLLGDPVDGSFRIFHTCDHGSTWLSSPDKYVAKGGEAAFAASNQSLVTMPYNFDDMLLITGGSVARLLYHDGGCELDGLWCHGSTRTVHLPLAHGNESSGAFAMAVLPNDDFNSAVKFPYTIVIVGGDYKQPEATNGVATTVYFYGFRSFPAGGHSGTARAAHTPPHGYRSAVAYDATTKTWITVGPNGTDISTDDGRNWRALKPLPGQPDDADQHWNALSLPFAVGPHGRIGILNPAALKPLNAPK
jgi:hypothetical protein